MTFLSPGDGGNEGGAGKLQLLTYQIHNGIQNKLQLNAAELERVRKGEVIQKEFRNDNDRKLRYVQLD